MAKVKVSVSAATTVAVATRTTAAAVATGQAIAGPCSGDVWQLATAALIAHLDPWECWGCTILHMLQNLGLGLLAHPFYCILASYFLSNGMP